MKRHMTHRSNHKSTFALAGPVLVGLVVLLIALLLAGCSRQNSVEPQNGASAISPAQAGLIDAGTYTVEAKYTKIFSYASGGGIFIVRLLPGDGFSGTVDLALSAGKNLRAELTTDVLTLDSPIAEITVRPNSQVDVTTYPVELTAVHDGDQQVITLEVEIFMNIPGNCGMSYNADREQPMFCDWLESEYPELGNFSQHTWQRYLTYDPPLIVEYWTFLNSEWEMRLAIHITWDPDKWAKFRLRPRGEWDPVLAAIHDSDDSWYEIPISEFPTLFGY